MFPGFQAFGANQNSLAVSGLAPLQIRLLAKLGDGIIFGGANSVGVSSDQDGTFVANGTGFHDIESLAGLALVWYHKS